MKTRKPKTVTTASSTETEATMTTPTKRKPKTVHATAPKTEATMSTNAPTTTTQTAATSAASAAPAASPKSAIIFLALPPASASIPAPPSGAAAPNAGNYRGFTPKATELAALPGAVEDLERFTNFTQVFGLTGLPYAQVLQAFQVSNAWSTMRKETAAWDGYSATQEGIAWATLRAVMDRLRSQFEAATALDASLPLTFPSLATLFDAKRAIAAKAVSTKRLNKLAKEKGEPEIHGVVGKRRQKQAAKAIVAAANAASSGTTPAPDAASSSPAPTATASAAPAAGANGAAHS